MKQMNSGNISWMRLVVVLVVLIVGIGLSSYGQRGSRTTFNNKKVDLNALPDRIGQWEYVHAQTFSPDIVAMLGTDAYTDRIYRSQREQEIELLISYYASMYEGKQFHSPKNCMLGSGWEVSEIGLINIGWHGKQLPINMMIVHKDALTLYVAYWVQGRGRIMATEIEERLYRVVDAFVRGRTDGAFVRITQAGNVEDRSRCLFELKSFAENAVQIVDLLLPE